MSVYHCEVCGAKLDIITTITDKDNYNQLLKAIHRYQRWVTEGKKEYEKEQWYYNLYHAGVSYDPESNQYNFNIQISDSCDGDTWWIGQCKYDGSEIKILKEKTYRH